MHSRASQRVLVTLLLFAYLVLTHAAVLTGIAFLAQVAWLGLAGAAVMVVPGVWGFGVGAALAAALAPADVPYLYFVSRNDGSHAFADTQIGRAHV